MMSHDPEGGSSVFVRSDHMLKASVNLILFLHDTAVFPFFVNLCGSVQHVSFNYDPSDACHCCFRVLADP